MADRISGGHVAKLLQEREHVVQISIANESLFRVGARVREKFLVRDLCLLDQCPVAVIASEPGGQYAGRDQRNERKSGSLDNQGPPYSGAVS